MGRRWSTDLAQELATPRLPVPRLDVHDEHQRSHLPRLRQLQLAAFVQHPLHTRQRACPLHLFRPGRRRRVPVGGRHPLRRFEPDQLRRTGTHDGPGRSDPGPVRRRPGSDVGTQRDRLQVRTAEVPLTMEMCNETSSKEKPCTVCKEFKPLSEYYNHPHTYDGLQTVCKTCHAKSSASSYRKMTPAEKDRRNARSKAARYGMTLEEMVAYVDAHNGLCDVCGKPDN